MWTCGFEAKTFGKTNYGLSVAWHQTIHFLVLNAVQHIGARRLCLLPVDHNLDTKDTTHQFFALFLGHPNTVTMEESFPRGGTRKTHKSEKEKAFQQSFEQDNLFDVSGVLF